MYIKLGQTNFLKNTWSQLVCRKLHPLCRQIFSKFDSKGSRTTSIRGKYLFKISSKYTRATSTDSAAVSLQLTLTRYLLTEMSSLLSLRNYIPYEHFVNNLTSKIMFKGSKSYNKVTRCACSRDIEIKSVKTVEHSQNRPTPSTNKEGIELFFIALKEVVQISPIKREGLANQGFIL